MPRWAGTTTTRGLGYEHQSERRRKLAALQDGTPCRRCSLPMRHPQRCCNAGCFSCTLDLGHPDDAPRVLTRGSGSGRSSGRELEHRRCNRAAGTRLGNRLRRRKRQHTRNW